MNDEEKAAPPPVVFPRKLDPMSIEALRAYIGDLEAEIARVETEIIRKEATRDHAESLFRKD